jgi:hypothetical protein
MPDAEKLSLTGWDPQAWAVIRRQRDADFVQ